ncbi:MAG: hypothetical protein E7573_02360 [Ruminococcaceae bacterium]|nr:hypothetical protein [Oscillospiraceae bacterium]
MKKKSKKCVIVSFVVVVGLCVAFLPGRLLPLIFFENEEIRKTVSEYQYFEYGLFPFAKYNVLVSLNNVTFNEAAAIFNDCSIEKIFTRRTNPLSGKIHSGGYENINGIVDSRAIFKDCCEKFYASLNIDEYYEGDEKDSVVLSEERMGSDILTVNGVKAELTGKAVNELLKNDKVILVEMMITNAYMNPITN